MDERRGERRQLADAAATLWWEHGETGAQVHAQVIDYSVSGLGVRSRSLLPRDRIVWCAVPSLGIYARTLVCHSRGLIVKTSGLRCLAGPLASR